MLNTETREVESSLCPCDIELVSSPDPTAGRHAWVGHKTNIELWDSTCQTTRVTTYSWDHIYIISGNVEYWIQQSIMCCNISLVKVLDMAAHRGLVLSEAAHNKLSNYAWMSLASLIPKHESVPEASKKVGGAWKQGYRTELMLICAVVTFRTTWTESQKLT